MDPITAELTLNYHATLQWAERVRAIIRRMEPQAKAEHDATDARRGAIVEYVAAVADILDGGIPAMKEKFAAGQVGAAVDVGGRAVASLDALNRAMGVTPYREK